MNACKPRLETLPPTTVRHALPITYRGQRCEGAGVETPFDIMEMEDEARDRLLDLPQSKVGAGRLNRA